MSKIHVLKSDNNRSYKVAIHFAANTGDNSAGHSWKQCGLESGLTGTTLLEIGTNPSNITQEEYDSITAGDIIEIIASINPGRDPTNNSIEWLCDIEIATWNEDVARILKYYGHKIEGA